MYMCFKKIISSMIKIRGYVGGEEVILTKK